MAPTPATTASTRPIRRRNDGDDESTKRADISNVRADKISIKNPNDELTAYPYHRSVGSATTPFQAAMGKYFSTLN